MWTKFDGRELKTHLAIQELVALNDVAKPFDVELMLDECAKNVAALFRGWLRRFGIICHRDEAFLPMEIMQWVLDYARYTAWTRIPNSGDICLDERRVNAYEKACDALNGKPPHIDPPDDPIVDPSSVDPVVHLTQWSVRFDKLQGDAE